MDELKVLGNYGIDNDDFIDGKCDICKSIGLKTSIVLTFNFLKPIADLSSKDQRLFLEDAKAKNEPEPKGIEIPLDQNLSADMCPDCITKCVSATSVTVSILNPEGIIANSVKTFC